MLRSRFARKLLLLSETELLNYCSVSFDILLSKVVKELLSVTNHLRKTSLRVEILGVLLHMLGKAVNSIGEDSNLNLGRTCVSLIDFVLFNDGGFCFLGNHFSSPFLKFIPVPRCSAGEKHGLRKNTESKRSEAIHDTAT